MLNENYQPSDGQADIRRMFMDLLFDSPADIMEPLNEDEEAFYHRVSSLIESESAVSKYIPSPPGPLMALLQELEEENTNFDRICEIIKGDLALLSETIKASNSPLYISRSGAIDSIEKAVGMLGLVGVAQIASVVMLRRVVDIDSGKFKSFGEVLWNHCLNTAEACKYIGDSESMYMNYLLGLVHDVGSMIIFKTANQFFAEVQNESVNSLKVVKLVMSEQSSWLSSLVAAEWCLPEKYLAVLNNYDRLVKYDLMDDGLIESLRDTLVLRKGSQCSQVYALLKENLLSKEEASVALGQAGITDEMATAIFDTYQKIDSTLH